MSIDTFLSAAWEDVKTFGEEEKQIIILAIKDVTNQFGPVVREAAKGAILEVKDTMFEADGTAKAKAATDIIISNLESQGIRVGIEVGIDFIKRTLEAMYKLLCAVWDDAMDAIGITPGNPVNGQPFLG